MLKQEIIGVGLLLSTKRQITTFRTKEYVKRELKERSLSYPARQFGGKMKVLSSLSALLPLFHTKLYLLLSTPNSLHVFVRSAIVHQLVLKLQRGALWTPRRRSTPIT